jgi:iron complex outermembrane receptor protein
LFETKTTSLKAKLLIGATSFAALGAAATSAQAQQVAGTESVIVTGSRIPQRGVEGSSPVTSVSSEEVKLQGAPSIVDLLKVLPSVVNDGDSDTTNNGTGGLATIDLRNLGAKRTLVLVDGKRLIASDASLDVDTNIIPAGMVERVEVATGGDSAVYGSDAVAGVINVILKKDFEGLQLDSQATVTDSWDGWKHDSYGMLGFNSADGKGNVTIYAEYMHRDPVSQGARDYGAHALNHPSISGGCNTTTFPATHFGGYCFSGSGTNQLGRIRSAALGGPFVGQTTQFTSTGTLAPYDLTTFNFAPYQYYQTQGTRYSFGANGHYEVNKNLDFYTRLTFADNTDKAVLGPSPLSANVFINCGNPLLSVEERQTIFGTTATTGTAQAQCATESATLYAAGNPNGNAAATPASPAAFAASQRLVTLALRLTQDGPRITSNDHNTYQLVGGFRGEVPGLKDFTYDISAQYGHTSNTRILFNDALKGNFQNGLLVDPATGNCYAGGSCVPLNIFTVGSISNAGINYIRENLLIDQSNDQLESEASVTGDLGQWGIKSPWARDPVGISIGGDYRQEHATSVPDANTASGNLVGFNSSTPVSGGFRVAEGFGELAIPIITDMEFAKDLSLKAAYRFSSYDKAGDVSTYRIGGQWAPIDDFKVRASYDRAVRAPNVSELFTPAGGTSSNSAIDPCSALTGAGITTTAALCNATGVPVGAQFTAALNCPTNQCQAAVGGNPFLKPEVAVTRELGFVITPTFVPGLTTTVDYYDININGFITATPTQTIINNCYSTVTNPTQSAAFSGCSFIHRDALGTIYTQNTGYVVGAEGNVGNDHVRGIDFEANYSMGLDMVGLDGYGDMNFNYRGTWVLENNTLFSGTVPTRCAGVFGSTCGEPQNRLKGNLRTTWTDPTGDLSISLLWRYIGAVGYERYRFTSPTLLSPTENIGAANYFDLSGTYALSPMLELRGGVRNLLGKSAPIVDEAIAPSSDVSGNTFPNTYDALGRQIFVGVTAKL